MEITACPDDLLIPMNTRPNIFPPMISSQISSEAIILYALRAEIFVEI